MSETHAEAPSVDRAVTRVMEILRTYKDESWNELILATGIEKHTLIRRRARGGWTAAEVATLAEHFDKPVSVFYAGPDALFQAAGEGTGSRMNRRYDDESMALAGEIFIPRQPLGLTA